ncbi:MULTISPECIES: RAxF-45 family protein [Virgibacillus]|nr:MULTISPECIES: RAxF-45 family protein [Virgibacillus]
MNQTGGITKMKAYLAIRYAIFSNNQSNGIRMPFLSSK